ncbi:MAG TPA: hypothetical protein VFX98_12905 [Longimicrobiaceae bacterium]|nr:hypothetical protein [Longimicrobiaceae bacterium]
MEEPTGGGGFFGAMIPTGEVLGASLVRDLPAECSLAVWQATRLLFQWAEAPEAERAEMFEPGTLDPFLAELEAGRFDEGLRLPTLLIVAELASGAADPERLARACLCLAEWALARRAAGSALYFAEAAALAWPESARHAWLAGALLQAHGRTPRAELWLRRALRVAARTGDWQAKSLALGALGNSTPATGSRSGARRPQRAAPSLRRRTTSRMFCCTWPITRSLQSAA